MYALVDCNNFYVSCERVFNPAIRNKPVVVLSNNDGCVIARSPESKKLGIAMGAPAHKMSEAFHRHNVHVFSSNYTLYGDMSHRVVETLQSFTHEIEVYSIDEAFMRLAKPPEEDWDALGRSIQKRVRQWTGIPVSVGIAPTKTLAKIANERAKERFETQGVLSLTSPQKWNAVLKQTEVSEVWGVGRNNSEKLQRHGIDTAWEFSQQKDDWIQSRFTIVGLRTAWELRGQPCLSLEEITDDRKGILSSRSFGRPVYELQELEEALADYTDRAARKLRAQNSVAHLIMVKLQTNKYDNRQPYYKNSATIRLPSPSSFTPDLISWAHYAQRQIYVRGYRYKKTSVMLLGITPDEQVQMNMFSKSQNDPRKERLMKSMDGLKRAYGKHSIKSASQGIEQNWRMRRQFVSPRYTTSLDQIPAAKTG